MRFYLIDQVTELVLGERARGVKNVTLADEVLHDHFPGFPLMPGTLLVESMAQLAGFLVEMTLGQEPGPLRRALLLQIDRARFDAPVGPGDVLDVRATLASSLGQAAQVDARIHVGARRVARARLTFGMTPIALESIHEQRRTVARIWTRHFDPPLSIP